MNTMHRREFLRAVGVSVAALPFAAGLPSLAAASRKASKQRIIFLFSPNGTVPDAFWPEQTGAEFTLKPILAPLEPFKSQLLLLKGVANKVRGDGDNHMRGMSCLLTGIELLPGNIQGGSHTPAGWAGGISIDQEIRKFLQSQSASQTRFGSLELGIGVPNKADPWTRWSYAGSNQPLAPLSDPYQVFDKLYGTMKDRESVASILDEVSGDLRTLARKVGSEDRQLLEKHTTFVREMEVELQQKRQQKLQAKPPALPPGVSMENDHLPEVFNMQAELLVNAFLNDMARVATVQFTNSVGNARCRWLGIDDGHHGLSHDPDLNKGSQEKLIKINTWICEQLAALVSKLRNTPEPGGSGSMLDHTLLIWTNELGKGNSHTLENIPFVLVGGGLNFKMGRALNLGGVAHNRLWLALAHAFGHPIETFGNKNLSQGGPLELT
jgi:hypothetical protein